MSASTVMIDTPVVVSHCCKIIGGSVAGLSNPTNSRAMTTVWVASTALRCAAAMSISASSLEILFFEPFASTVKRNSSLPIGAITKTSLCFDRPSRKASNPIRPNSFARASSNGFP